MRTLRLTRQMMVFASFLPRCLFIGVLCAGVGWEPMTTQAQNLTYTPTPNNPVGRAPQAIATGDFNGDGLWDLATGNGTSDDVSVLVGNGNGTFRSAVSFGVGKIPLALVAEDMDQDGVLDLVVSLSGVDEVVVLKGDGKGFFQKLSQQKVGKGATFVAVHDLNGDGWRDVVTANSGRFGYYPPFNLSVLMNDGTGGLQEPMIYEDARGKDLFPTGVLVEELTGDDLKDLAITWSQPSWSAANGLVSILENAGGWKISII